MSARAHGFSLIQLLIIVAITAIIASQSVQSFSAMLKAVELKGAVQLVYFQIQAARHQAVARQQDIQIDIVDGQYWCIEKIIIHHHLYNFGTYKWNSSRKSL